MPGRRKKVFSAEKEVKAIARERVGVVKPSAVILPRDKRRPKHKPDLLRDPE